MFSAEKYRNLKMFSAEKYRNLKMFGIGCALGILCLSVPAVVLYSLLCLLHSQTHSAFVI